MSPRPTFFPTTELNPPQRQAVYTARQHVVVLSGAGTGKTTVIVNRAFRLTTLTAPNRLMIVTYGNKAAKELHHRIGTMRNADDFWYLGTYHSIGNRILRRVCEEHGLTREYKTAEPKEIYRIIRASIQARGLDDIADTVTVSKRIDHWKNYGLLPGQALDQVETSHREAVERINREGGDKDALRIQGAIYSADLACVEIYRDYESTMRQMNRIDFGDMLLLPVLSLYQSPRLRAQWAGWIDHIMVDEFQDTNEVQYDLIRLLKGDRTSLFVVGDDDQALYEWRGAVVGNIRRVMTEYPDVELVTLEQNYRSTQPILDLPNALAVKIPDRIEKRLFSTTTEGRKPILRASVTDVDEATFIAHAIRWFMEEKRTPPSQIAILMRVNRLTRLVEDALAQAKIPFAVLGDRFYDREEIKDAIALLKLVHYPTDLDSFLRIVNKPRRGIGEARAEKIIRLAPRVGGDPIRAMLQLAHDGAFRDQEATLLAVTFADSIARARHALDDGTPLGNLLEQLIKDTGYGAYLAGDDPETTLERTGNLEELQVACGRFGTLDALLNHAERATGSQAKTDDAVQIMTIFKAKGLEFDVVFIPGFEAGLIPHPRAVERGASGVAGERRIAHVGLTRGRLAMLLCQSVIRGGKPKVSSDELPQEVLINAPLCEYLVELGDELPKLVSVSLDKPRADQPNATSSALAPIGVAR